MEKVLWASSVLACLWWLVAWLFPSPLNTDPLNVKRILALMGLVFLVAGLHRFLVSKSGWSFLFALNCLSGMLHWAGPIGNNAGLLGEILYGVYVVFASVLYGSLFLHISLAFPDRQQSSKLLVLIYLPGLIAIPLVCLSLAGFVEQSLLFLMFSVGSVYGLLGGVVWLVRLFTANHLGLSKAQAILIALALLTAWLPNGMVQAGLLDLGESGGLTNLTIIGLIVALSWLGARDPGDTNNLTKSF